MGKNIIITLLLIMFMHVSAQSVVVYKKNFSPVAGHLMHDENKKALYWTALHDVPEYLPEKHKIKRKAIKLIDDRLLPGKTPLKVARHFMNDKKSVQIVESLKNIFEILEENKPHTYVISHDRLIFTESTSNPSLELFKDKFSKHFLISGLAKSVNYSGELHIYKNPANREVFAVFDNSSGTYQPPTELLPQVQQLLDLNLNRNSGQEKLYIITKSYKQKIDISKLFSHDPQPFV